jgi:hypothetical protein
VVEIHPVRLCQSPEASPADAEQSKSEAWTVSVEALLLSSENRGEAEAFAFFSAGATLLRGNGIAQQFRRGLRAGQRHGKDSPETWEIP